MAFGLKLEPCSVQCSLKMVRAIDEKHGVFDIVFLAKLAEKYLGKSRCRGGKQPQMEQLVCLWISSNVQPVLLIVDGNHCLISHNLIRSFAAGRL